MHKKWLTFWQHFWKDSKGAIVVWQFPNPPLWGWIFCTLVAHFIGNGRFKDGVQFVGTVLLAYWAVSEVTRGASYFRRLLGILVLGYIVVSLVVQS
ncbi:MAG TPA: hypothetical protein VLF60_05300 [Candidatus Saccharimonadales bacterium]|nr:hypothetical protein [Candidatus Saccharimonadales bacterium]